MNLLQNNSSKFNYRTSFLRDNSSYETDNHTHSKLHLYQSIFVTIHTALKNMQGKRQS
jgi:hypothetical protein